MRKQQIIAGRRCPKCGEETNQVNAGYNQSGTQRCRCRNCGSGYTFNPKTRAYPEEVREQAIRIYYSGVSGRGVGKILHIGKSNVYNWIKKNGARVDKSDDGYGGL